MKDIKITKEESTILSFLSETLSKVYNRQIIMSSAKEIIYKRGVEEISIYSDGKVMTKYDRTIITDFNCCIIIIDDIIHIHLNSDNIINSIYTYIENFDYVIKFDTEEKKKKCARNIADDTIKKNLENNFKENKNDKETDLLPLLDDLFSKGLGFYYI